MNKTLSTLMKTGLLWWAATGFPLIGFAGDIESYPLIFSYSQAANPNDQGGWSASFSKSVSWLQSTSFGFNKAGFNLNFAAETAGSLGLNGTLSSNGDTASAELSGKFQIDSSLLSPPKPGTVRLALGYTPTATALTTNAAEFQLSSGVKLQNVEAGIGGSVGVPGYSFSGNLDRSGNVATSNLLNFSAQSTVLTYNANNDGKVDVFGYSTSLPGKGLVPIPRLPTGVTGLVNANPQLITSGRSTGTNKVISSGAVSTVASYQFKSRAADFITPLPIGPDFSGTLAGLIPDPNSSNKIKEGLYEAAEAILSEVGVDPLEAGFGVQVGYKQSYSFQPTSTLHYSLQVQQTGERIDGDTRLGYADIASDGHSTLTVRPTVTLDNPILSEQTYMTITPYIVVQALEAQGFGYSFGPVVDETYDLHEFDVAVPGATGSEELKGAQTFVLPPDTFDVPGAAIPEPAPLTMTILGVGLLICGITRRSCRAVKRRSICE